MGMIIFPVWAIAFVIEIFVIRKLILSYNNGELLQTDMWYGLALSLILYLLLIFKYKFEGKVWALSPLFRVPIVMVIVLFIANKILGTSGFESSNIISVSIFLNAILGFFFVKYFKKLVNYLGVKTHY